MEGRWKQWMEEIHEHAVADTQDDEHIAKQEQAEEQIEQGCVGGDSLEAGTGRPVMTDESFLDQLEIRMAFKEIEDALKNLGRVLMNQATSRFVAEVSEELD
ncbi:MAG: hypothetical protein Q9207_002914 [Kuettlingeria erythrocarpa]